MKKRQEEGCKLCSTERGRYVYSADHGRPMWPEQKGCRDRLTNDDTHLAGDVLIMKPFSRQESFGKRLHLGRFSGEDSVYRFLRILLFLSQGLAEKYKPSLLHQSRKILSSVPSSGNGPSPSRL